jgi:hypothetical protein
MSNPIFIAEMGLYLGMEVPGWPPDNIDEPADELAKRFERSVRTTDDPR